MPKFKASEGTTMKQATLALLLTLIFSSPLNAKDYKTYFGTVSRIIDGDTLEAQVKIWPEIKGDFKIRIREVNTPEMNARKGCKKSKLWARIAKKRVEQLYPIGTRIKLEDIKKDNFGRYLAHVSKFDNGGWVSLGKTLLSENLAVPYNRKMTKETWCSDAEKLYGKDIK